MAGTSGTAYYKVNMADETTEYVMEQNTFDSEHLSILSEGRWYAMPYSVEEDLYANGKWQRINKKSIPFCEN